MWSLWKTRMRHATNLRSRPHLEQRWNREILKSFCTTAAPTVIFALLTPSSLSRSASEASVGCGGNSSSFFHKNSAPFLHISSFFRWGFDSSRSIVCRVVFWSHMGPLPWLWLFLYNGHSVGNKGNKSSRFVSNILQGYHRITLLSNTVNPQSPFKLLSYDLLDPGSSV